MVSGIADLVQRIHKEGYRIVDDQPLEGFERVYVYDPFGNRLELMEPLARID